MAERYGDAVGGARSEYGGGDGSPQRYKDGSSIPLEDLASGDTVSERARLMRTVGMADFDAARNDLVGRASLQIDVTKLSVAEYEAYMSEMEESRRRAAERAALAARTNGYSEEPSTYVGESGEGAGVEPFDA